MLGWRRAELKHDKCGETGEKRYPMGQWERYRSLPDTMTDPAHAPARALASAVKGHRANPNNRAPATEPEVRWSGKDLPSIGLAGGTPGARFASDDKNVSSPHRKHRGRLDEGSRRLGVARSQNARKSWE